MEGEKNLWKITEKSIKNTFRSPYTEQIDKCLTRSGSEVFFLLNASFGIPASLIEGFSLVSFVLYKAGVVLQINLAAYLSASIQH